MVADSILLNSGGLVIFLWRFHHQPTDSAHHLVPPGYMHTANKHAKVEFINPSHIYLVILYQICCY